MSLLKELHQLLGIWTMERNWGVGDAAYGQPAIRPLQIYFSTINAISNPSNACPKDPGETQAKHDQIIVSYRDYILPLQGGEWVDKTTLSPPTPNPNKKCEHLFGCKKPGDDSLKLCVAQAALLPFGKH